MKFAVRLIDFSECISANYDVAHNEGTFLEFGIFFAIKVIKKCQNCRTEPEIQIFLNTMDIWKDEDIYRMSKMHEASGQQVEIERFDSKSFARAVKSLQSHEKVSFGKLTSRDWKLLLSYAQPVKFAKDTIILQQGAKNQYYFRIKSGTCRLSKVVVSKIK